jgi:hypothetical protein
VRLFLVSPAVLWSLALVAIPVLIHLLLRPQIARVRFPSLRFVPASRLASARRRIVHDWPLLLVRMAIVALAVVALSGPVLVTPGRERAWTSRTVRAIVVDAEAAMSAAARVQDLVDESAGDALAATRIETTRIGEGLVQAAQWLERAPPAAREVVIVSDLRNGAVTARDLAMLPAGVGVRLREVGGTTPTAGTVRRLRYEAGGAVASDLEVILGPVSTAVARAGRDEEVDLPVRVTGRDEARHLLEAALVAVLMDGLLIAAPPAPVHLAWDTEVAAVEPLVSAGARQAFSRFVAAAGVSNDQRPGAAAADPWVRIWPGVLAAAERDGALVLRGTGLLDADTALGVARAALAAAHATPDLGRLETMRMPAEARAALERDALPADPGAVAAAGDTDARWAWALVLLLMGTEHWMRRRKPLASGGSQGGISPHQEARVA